MNKFRFTIRILAIAIFTFAFASIAQAQASRTWVSGVGDDANPCSRTAPCKTFAGAISKTAACGEINVLDPGGFGAVTITKSITIDATGSFGSILASLVTGITINATDTDVITIRGLSIDGFCNGLRAMNILQAKTVNIEDCVMFRFNGPGILVNETNNIQLNVRNTVVRDNVGAGLDLSSSGGEVKATLFEVSLTGNLHGIHAKRTSRVNASNCNFSNNSQNGVFADATSVVALIRVWNCQLSLNGQNGARAGNVGGGVSLVEIAQSQLNQNTGSGALVGTGGIVETFGNNSIRGNGTDGCVGCTAVGPGN